jgi:hypothetical protein
MLNPATAVYRKKEGKWIAIIIRGGFCLFGHIISIAYGITHCYSVLELENE